MQCSPKKVCILIHWAGRSKVEAKCSKKVLKFNWKLDGHMHSDVLMMMAMMVMVMVVALSAKPSHGWHRSISSLFFTQIINHHWDHHHHHHHHHPHPENPVSLCVKCTGCRALYHQQHPTPSRPGLYIANPPNANIVVKIMKYILTWFVIRGVRCLVFLTMLCFNDAIF